MKYTCWCEEKEAAGEDDERFEYPFYDDQEDYLARMLSDARHHAYLEGRDLSRATTRELPTASELAGELSRIVGVPTASMYTIAQALIKWMGERQ